MQENIAVLAESETNVSTTERMNILGPSNPSATEGNNMKVRKTRHGQDSTIEDIESSKELNKAVLLKEDSVQKVQTFLKEREEHT